MARDLSPFELAVSEVQKQQAESLVRMEALRKQHLDWELAVQTMLQQIHETCQQQPEALEALRMATVSTSRASEALQNRSRVSRSSVSGGSLELQKLRASASASNLEKVVVREEPSPTGESCGSRSSATSFQRNRAASNGSTLMNKRNSQHSKLLEEIMRQGHQAQERNPTVWDHRRKRLARIVDSTAFECGTGFIILLNIVLIGAEAQFTVQGRDTGWATHIEQAFLVIYTLELLMRFAAGSWPLFKNGWFLLDFFLVIVGLLAVVVIPAIESTASEGFEQVLVVRGLRLLRLARVLRMVHRFKVIWRLVSGLLAAWDTMVSTTCLIMIWLYIFGCVALEFITLDEDLLADPLTARIITENFGSLPKAVLTLLQFVTMDAIANVYFPLIMAKPVLVIYFLPLLMFLSIGLMNLVTAVLVEHALEHASQEAEMARINQKQQIKATMPDLLEVFQGLDADGSGSLTRQELADVPVSVLPPNVLENVSVDSMEDLFEMLDVDGGGTLTQDEFLEGLLSLLLLDVPIWAIQLQKQLIQLYKSVMSISPVEGVARRPNHKMAL